MLKGGNEKGEMIELKYCHLDQSTDCIKIVNLKSKIANRKFLCKPRQS